MEILEKNVINTDFETRSLDAPGTNTVRQESAFSMLKYAIAGIGFGIVLIKAEVISWFRIQEMFRFESFHMYGVIGSAVVVGIISVFLIKRTQTKAITGEPITFSPKAFNRGLIFGGGFPVIIVTLLSAIAGTWCYGLLRTKLPH
jgi:hypothetical protein